MTFLQVEIEETLLLTYYTQELFQLTYFASEKNTTIKYKREATLKKHLTALFLCGRHVKNKSLENVRANKDHLMQTADILYESR